MQYTIRLAAYWLQFVSINCEVYLWHVFCSLLTAGRRPPKCWKKQTWASAGISLQRRKLLNIGCRKQPITPPSTLAPSALAASRSSHRSKHAKKFKDIHCQKLLWKLNFIWLKSDLILEITIAIVWVLVHTDLSLYLWIRLCCLKFLFRSYQAFSTLNAVSQPVRQWRSINSHSYFTQAWDWFRS